MRNLLQVEADVDEEVGHQRYRHSFHRLGHHHGGYVTGRRIFAMWTHYSTSPHETHNTGDTEQRLARCQYDYQDRMDSRQDPATETVWPIQAIDTTQNGDSPQDESDPQQRFDFRARAER